MANPSQYPEHDAPRLTRAVQALVALNVAILFLQWTVVSDADVFAVLGFQTGDLQRTLWSSFRHRTNSLPAMKRLFVSRKQFARIPARMSCSTP